jgi:hypothetical protein
MQLCNNFICYVQNSTEKLYIDLRTRILHYEVTKTTSMLLSYLCWTVLLQTYCLKPTCLLPYSCRSQKWTSDWIKTDLSTGLWSFLEILGRKSFSWLFQVLGYAHMPWPMTSFHLQSQQWPLKSVTHCITLISSLESPFKFKTLSDYIGPTWIT